MSSPDPPAQLSLGRPPGGRPETVDVDERVDADRLYALRATLAAHATELGAPQEQVEHLLIIASELATNAIRHGGGAGRLRMWHRGDVLYCQVSDEGPGIADPTVGSTPPDPAGSDGGRGIWICRNLAGELSIEAGERGRGAVVTAAIPGLDGAPAQ